MSPYSATIRWQRNKQNFTDNKYSRKHRWQFDGGLEVPASASPSEVAPPQSDPTAIDPEEAFVAAVSSCHMLWFLSIAAKQGYIIEEYQDHAEGFMTKNENGFKAITKIILYPKVIFGQHKALNQQKFDKLHKQAHNMCFIAHSVTTKITIKASFEVQ